MRSKYYAQTQFLFQSELATRWRISEKTLERWRYEGKRPSFTKLNGRVLYHITDIIKFEKECKVHGLSMHHLEDNYE